mmetsp:Transcript_34932/g.56219  ORF Transcript_34932/g.56219 Transcript_34932/m.56219 type:complete len:120 (+) Transcript_34932:1717-2076(+)
MICRRWPVSCFKHREGNDQEDLCHDRRGSGRNQDAISRRHQPRHNPSAATTNDRGNWYRREGTHSIEATTAHETQQRARAVETDEEETQGKQNPARRLQNAVQGAPLKRLIKPIQLIVP